MAIIAIIAPVALPVAVYAADPPNKSAVCDGIEATGGSCDSNGGTTVNTIIENIINILSFVVGVVAVIAIIIAGLQFVTADGNQEKIAKARTAILYAVIGLVVVAIAQLIVVFVLKSTTKSVTTLLTTLNIV